MRDECGVESVRSAGVEQGFKAPGGTVKIFDGLDVGTEGRHRDEFTRAGRIS